MKLVYEIFFYRAAISAEFKIRTRLSFEVFSLESLWTLDYVFAPLPLPGIGLSLAVMEGQGEGLILQP